MSVEGEDRERDSSVPTRKHVQPWCSSLMSYLKIISPSNANHRTVYVHRLALKPILCGKSGVAVCLPGNACACLLALLISAERERNLMRVGLARVARG